MEQNYTRNVRAKMTNMMMERIYKRSNGGQSMEEILMDIAQSPDSPQELRFKAASKVADLIFPRAAAVEVDMNTSIQLTGKEIDSKLAELIATLPKKAVEVTDE